ncbi:hypothetical protein KR76_00081 [Pimelobacter simplex]|uniref:Uncharacterized protein n=1 Tax=Nocardioides simplex TaxID=2045 RepID=A0A0C5XLE8_NOCSI|nr:hypothetical protein KR76_00081 [Pimelobacter simplex]
MQHAELRARRVVLRDPAPGMHAGRLAGHPRTSRRNRWPW